MCVSVTQAGKTKQPGFGVWRGSHGCVATRQKSRKGSSHVLKCAACGVALLFLSQELTRFFADHLAPLQPCCPHHLVTLH